MNATRSWNSFMPHRRRRDVEVGTPVALEATIGWYWIADEIEAAGCVPALVHPYKSKVMLGCINKTDKLDVHGLNRLQRTGTLPTVWIPPAGLRDQRELPRVRMFLVRHRSRLKNRIQAELTKYGVPVLGVSDPFGRKGQALLRANLEELPPVTRQMTEALLDQYAFVDQQVRQTESQIERLLAETPAMRMSQQLAISMPAPMQLPSICAIRGRSHASMAARPPQTSFS